MEKTQTLTHLEQCFLADYIGGAHMLEVPGTQVIAGIKIEPDEVIQARSKAFRFF